MKRPIPLTLKVVLIYLGWAIFCGLFQARIITRFGFSWDEALKDTAITQFIIAIGCFALNKSLGIAIPTFRNLSTALCQVIAATALATLAQQALIEEIIKATDYSIFLKSALYIRIFYNGLMILLIATITWFWGYFRDQQESIKRKEDAEKLSREAELANLRQQLQPHFLFNSLNSISALVGSQPERARNMIQQLSDFLRGTLKKDDKQLVTLKEELEHLQLYLEIEKVRFGHRLETTISTSDESLALTLPSLLLQPIVENAIKFGLYDTLEKIEITIDAKSQNNQLVIEVKNPFDPITAAPKRGTGFGLQSVNRRLFLVYGQSDLLHAKQIDKQFITAIKVPQYA